MQCPQCKAPADVLETRTYPTYRYRRYLCFNDHRLTDDEIGQIWFVGHVGLTESDARRLVRFWEEAR